MSKVVNLIDELDGLVQENSEESLSVRSYLDTGLIPLNVMLSGNPNGGIAAGRIHEIFGMQSCGKTAIATFAMMSAIKANGIAMFEDHERSFDLAQARHLGLPKDSGRFLYQKPNTYEESYERILKVAVKVRQKQIIPDEAPLVAVIDSLASCIPRSIVAKLTGTDDKGEMEDMGKMEDINMRDKLALATATSDTFKVFANFAERFNMTLIVLNQLRENPAAGPGDNTRTPGGKAPGFYASTRLKLSAAKLVKDVKGKKVQIGQQVTCTSIKNKTYRPFLATQWDFLFDENGRGHIDTIGANIDFAKEVGKLDVSGNYVVWEGKKYYKSQLIELIQEKALESELDKLCRA